MSSVAEELWSIDASNMFLATTRRNFFFVGAVSGEGENAPPILVTAGSFGFDTKGRIETSSFVVLLW